MRLCRSVLVSSPQGSDIDDKLRIENKLLSERNEELEASLIEQMA